ncbi:phosphotransferase enzyme family protein [Microbacterium sp.]|uniref:phosphotransferase enzyme family protein n=1 Tax=Microbacterium sp. TaxID=51671 RepID=UPI0039E538AE
MTTVRSQIAHRRTVALAALREYALPAGALRFVNHGENTTFRHESEAGRFLVRVHRPQRHGRDIDSALAIRSELAWLQALRASAGLEVPEVLPASDGRAVVGVEVDGAVLQCSVLRWMDGRIVEASPRPIHLERVGAAMAELHRQADAWTRPAWFTRIHWDHETFFGDVMVHGEVSAGGCWDLLPVALRTRFEAVRERLGPMLADERDAGLIHADLHLGNAVFEAGRVKLIDFDDCGFGPRIYDVAVALWEQRDRGDYPRFRDALLAGYRSVRALDTARLDDYIALRQVAFQLWHTGMARTNPAFAERRAQIEEWSQHMLDVVGA